MRLLTDLDAEGFALATQRLDADWVARLQHALDVGHAGAYGVRVSLVTESVQSCVADPCRKCGAAARSSVKSAD